MDEDSSDLYGDLENAGKDVEIMELKRKLNEEKDKNKAFTKQIAQLKEQLLHLVQDRQILETNLLSVYNTAKVELKRKDNEISALRAEKRK
jgi:CII-binding regulator of phage lambda lysogenization HflD